MSKETIKAQEGLCIVRIYTHLGNNELFYHRGTKFEAVSKSFDWATQNNWGIIHFEVMHFEPEETK